MTKRLSKLAPMVLAVLLLTAVAVSAADGFDYCRALASNPDSLGLQWGCYLQVLLGW